MEYKIVTSENLKSSTWSGGRTTELFIFPTGANYKKKNFDFRLSTATVEVEQSEFTSLPNISRKLMILDGKIILSHKNRDSKEMNKFDMASFEGDWETSSVGKCTDFNLMTTGNTKGELSATILEREKSRNYEIKDNPDWIFMYAYSGKVKITLNGEKNVINKGDFLIIKKPIIANFNIKALEKSELIFAEIY